MNQRISSQQRSLLKHALSSGNQFFIKNSPFKDYLPGTGHIFEKHHLPDDEFENANVAISERQKCFLRWEKNDSTLSRRSSSFTKIDSELFNASNLVLFSKAWRRTKRNRKRQIRDLKPWNTGHIKNFGLITDLDNSSSRKILQKNPSFIKKKRWPLQFNVNSRKRFASEANSREPQPDFGVSTKRKITKRYTSTLGRQSELNQFHADQFQPYVNSRPDSISASHSSSVLGLSSNSGLSSRLQPNIYQTSQFSQTQEKNMMSTSAGRQIIATGRTNGLQWIAKPPRKVLFSNSSGGLVDCAVGGSQLQVSIQWTFEDGRIVMPQDLQPLHQDLQQLSMACSNSSTPNVSSSRSRRKSNTNSTKSTSSLTQYSPTKSTSSPTQYSPTKSTSILTRYSPTKSTSSPTQYSPTKSTSSRR
ncbi:hypothetical protein FHG87_002553 [Trinorchestia longiramus]|nr:hypothetical protein FHG87_002553 [Trinorchestia longiramus]